MPKTATLAQKAIRKVRPIGPTMVEIAGAIKSRSPVNAFLRHRCEAVHMDSLRLELYRHGYSRFVETSMHGSRGKEDGFFAKWGFGFVVLPVLLAVAMVVLCIVQPKTIWIADIVQKEFPGNSASPGEAPTPRQ